MNLNTINVIIGREYTTRVKKRSFLITTFLVPVLFAVICVLPSLLMLASKEKAQNIGVVDQSGLVMPFFANGETMTFNDMSSENPDSLKADLGSAGIDVLLIVSPVDPQTKTVAVQAYSEKPLGVDFSSSVSRMAEDAVEDFRIRSYDIENLAQIMEDVKADVKVTEYTLDKSGNESLSESGIYMGISMFLGMIIYMFIVMFSAMVMSSVIEEKASRVVEVLISSVKATELMFGKIVGVAMVALTQFLMWVVLTVVLLAGAGAIFGMDTVSQMAADSAMTADVSSMGINPDILTQQPAEIMAQQPSEMSAILTTLANLPYVKLIISFIIYFVLGYLLYASLFAAIGSAAENEADTQQLQIPVTIPLMIGFFIVFMAFKNPDSPVVFWGSMIPFTSPIVMLARIPYGVAMWELVLSIVLLVLTFAACAWLSARIYKVGILMFGKKTTFKDLWKWLRQ